jgi:hypothetical protein
MPYLLDANVFITAKRLHYGFDFCPGFWDWLRGAHEAGNLFSIDSVRDELTGQQDDLSQWVAGLPDAFFIRPGAGTLNSYETVTRWAADPRYSTPARNNFFNTADYHLVAQAHEGGYTVVTHEVPSGSPNKIKIPDACLGLRVAYLLPHELLRRERARFVLQTAP